MEQIIIPKEQVEKYTRIIEIARKGKYRRYMMIQPIPVKTATGEIYILPPGLIDEPIVSKEIDKLVALEEIDKTLAEFPVQDIKIIPTEEILGDIKK